MDSLNMLYKCIHTSEPDHNTLTMFHASYMSNTQHMCQHMLHPCTLCQTYTTLHLIKILSEFLLTTDKWTITTKPPYIQHIKWQCYMHSQWFHHHSNMILGRSFLILLVHARTKRKIKLVTRDPPPLSSRTMCLFL